jgi:hypothetical protein
MIKFSELSECLACLGTSLEQVLDLGSQPLANNFTSNSMPAEYFPLALNFCHACSHLQLTHSVNRENLFDNYLYASGTSNTLKDDFKDFATELTKIYGAKTVVDIACNDGSQLDEFKKLGWGTLGIDPAKNLFELSTKKHIVIRDYLRYEHAKFIKSDLVIAQNVIAHVDKPGDMLTSGLSIAPIMYAQVSQANMISRGEFDTIYHEHLSFFSTLSFWTLAKRTNHSLVGFSYRNIHGVSQLFEVHRSGSAVEKPRGLDFASLQEFSRKTSHTIQQLNIILAAERKSGATLIGLGASAKGMTVLNALDETLDFFLDDSPLKQGLFTPGKGVPVMSFDFLKDLHKPIVFVLTAWNFEKELKSRLDSFENIKNFKLLQYFPEVIIK